MSTVIEDGVIRPKMLIQTRTKNGREYWSLVLSVYRDTINVVEVINNEAGIIADDSVRIQSVPVYGDYTYANPFYGVSNIHLDLIEIFDVQGPIYDQEYYGIICAQAYINLGFFHVDPNEGAKIDLPYVQNPLFMPMFGMVGSVEDGLKREEQHAIRLNERRKALEAKKWSEFLRTIRRVKMVGKDAKTILDDIDYMSYDIAQKADIIYAVYEKWLDSNGGLNLKMVCDNLFNGKPPRKGILGTKTSITAEQFKAIMSMSAQQVADSLDVKEAIARNVANLAKRIISMQANLQKSYPEKMKVFVLDGIADGKEPKEIISKMMLKFGLKEREAVEAFGSIKSYLTARQTRPNPNLNVDDKAQNILKNECIMTYKKYDALVEACAKYVPHISDILDGKLAIEVEDDDPLLKVMVGYVLYRAFNKRTWCSLIYNTDLRDAMQRIGGGKPYQYSTAGIVRDNFDRDPTAGNYQKSIAFMGTLIAMVKIAQFDEDKLAKIATNHDKPKQLAFLLGDDVVKEFILPGGKLSKNMLQIAAKYLGIDDDELFAAISAG